MYPCCERRRLAVDSHVMEQLFRVHEQVVEPVDFRPGVGQPSTLAHDGVKTVGIVGIEREEHGDGRVPRVSPDRAHEVTTHFALGTSVRRQVVVNHFTIKIGGFGDRRRIEDADVPRKPGSQEMIVHSRDGSRGPVATFVRQQFEPLAKPLHIETLFAARSSAAPEIEIEEGGQLGWCCRSDDFSTGFESVMPDQLMQRF